MNPVELIRLHESEFTKSDEKIKNYVLNHFDAVASYAITDVAELAHVSKSALLRFCQKIGYQGYSEFKYEVSRYLLSGSSSTTSSANRSTDILQLYISSIQNIPQTISGSLMLKVCQLIKEARKIKIYGLHESGLSAQYFSFRLTSLGLDAEALHLSETFSQKAAFSQPEDLNIFISLSGTTSCICEAAKEAFSKKAKTVIITQNAQATYRNKYDCFLMIPSMNLDKNTLFLDSQCLVFVCINLLINTLAGTL